MKRRRLKSATVWGAVGLACCLGIAALRSSAEETSMTRETTSARRHGDDPWEEFCERLKRAGRVMQRDTTPQDDLTQAEGYRKLVHFIRVGFDANLDFADTEHPRVYPHVTPTTLGEGETADARYHQAFIDGSASYRVSGERGTAAFIEFGVYAGKIGIQDSSRQVGALTEQNLVVGEDGSYEIVLSPDEHSGNWIRTESDASLLYIRQYAHDWNEARSATFEIRREGVTGPRPPLCLAEAEEGLMRTAAFVDHAVHFWAAIVDRQAATEPNVFREVGQAQAAESPEMPVGHRFSAGYFRLAPEEALVVRFSPGQAPYWGLDLTNYWFEPLSYEDHRSHVNNRTASFEPDGSVRIVIAEQRRGASNWIDLQGHREGMMLFRWSRSRDPLPAIASQVGKLADL